MSKSKHFQDDEEYYGFTEKKTEKFRKREKEREVKYEICENVKEELKNGQSQKYMDRTS